MNISKTLMNADHTALIFKLVSPMREDKNRGYTL